MASVKVWASWLGLGWFGRYRTAAGVLPCVMQQAGANGLRVWYGQSVMDRAMIRGGGGWEGHCPVLYDGGGGGSRGREGIWLVIYDGGGRGGGLKQTLLLNVRQ